MNDLLPGQVSGGGSTPATDNRRKFVGFDGVIAVGSFVRHRASGELGVVCSVQERHALVSWRFDATGRVHLVALRPEASPTP